MTNPRPGWSVYGSAPETVHGLTERQARRLARRYRRFGIRASLYSPGNDGELALRARTADDGRTLREAGKGEK